MNSTAKRIATIFGIVTVAVSPLLYSRAGESMAQTSTPAPVKMPGGPYRLVHGIPGYSSAITEVPSLEDCVNLAATYAAGWNLNKTLCISAANPNIGLALNCYSPSATEAEPCAASVIQTPHLNVLREGPVLSR